MELVVVDGRNYYNQFPNLLAQNRSNMGFSINFVICFNTKSFIMTKEKIAFYLSIGLGLFLMLSVFGKLSSSEEVVALLSGNGMGDWITIVGIGELLSVILFIIPRTYKLGTVLLSAYFGGAIVFHMTHPDPAAQGFVGPAIFLVVIWILSWLRGNELLNL